MRGLLRYHAPMMQASQTIQKEKAPSAPTLKGFELFDAECACVVLTAPRGTHENRHDIDQDSHMMRHKQFVALCDVPIKAKVTRYVTRDVMVLQRIKAYGKPPPPY